MKALISLNQSSFTGARIVQVEPDANTFPVAPDLAWVDCPDNCIPDLWYYDPVGKTVMAPLILSVPDTISKISLSIQSALDFGAQAWQYDSLATAASYINSTVAQYASDAKALIAWRDAVWSWAIPQFATIVAGTDPQTFMANMPVQPTQPKV